MADDIDLRARINVFVRNQCCLLDIEFEEEKKAFQYDINAPQVGQLEKKGLLINKLQVTNVLSEFGACVVEFSRTCPEKSFHPSTFRQGDVVSVWLSDVEAHGKKTCLAIGTMVQCSDVIRLSFDHAVPFKWDLDKTTYFIIKTASSVTYRRLKRALENVKKHLNGRSYPVIKLLVGEAELEKMPLHPNRLNERGELIFFNDKLHKSQKEAVTFCLEQKHFAMVHGPPGTGKTTVLVEVILQLCHTGHKILVCTPSNIASDIYIDKLKPFQCKAVRMGKSARMVENAKDSSIDALLSKREESSILETVKEEMAVNKSKLKSADHGDKNYFYEVLKGLKSEFFVRHTKMIRSILENADVILSTLLTASDDGDLKYLPRDYFDVVIIDECSQAIEAACWIAIPRAPKIILAGDPCQLPPTVKSEYAKQNGLDITLMERAYIKVGAGCQKALFHQFRMNSAIMDWVNDTFYESELVADERVANCLLKDLPNIKETQETATPLLVVDTAEFCKDEEEFGGSKFNEAEGDVVAVLTNRLINAGVQETDIAVITPYSMQVACIKKKISNYPNVEVRTVDGFQGREKRAVIISFVRANDKRELGFLTDFRRLNVAISRAQFFLAVVGNSLTVRRDRVIRDFWNYVEDNGTFYSACELTKEMEELNIPRFTIETLMPQKTQYTRKENLGKKSNANGASGESAKVGSAKKMKYPLIQNASTCLKESTHLEKMTSEAEKNMTKCVRPAKKTRENRNTNFESPEENSKNSLGTDPKDLPNGKNKQISETSTKVEAPQIMANNSSGKVVFKLDSNFKSCSEKKSRSETYTKQIKDCQGLKTSPLEVLVTDVEKANTYIGGEPIDANMYNESNSEAIEESGKSSYGAVPKLTPNGKKKQMSSTCASSEMDKFSNQKEDNENQKSKLRTRYSKTEKKNSPQTQSKCDYKDSDQSNNDLKLIEKSTRRKTSCRYQNCKTITGWLLVLCNHCRDNFCLQHLQPEIHGCGNAAKLEARHSLKSNRSVKPSDKDRELTKGKLKMKIAQCALERKSKQKNEPKK